MGRYGKLFLVGVLIVAGGCMPGVHVKKNPADNDKGIRYYRPKPYLFISPSGTVTKTVKDKTETTVTEKSDEFVNIELQYLPDFSEEYAIDVRTGFGTANVEINLEDGWNLTSINQELDSQTDENLEGIASVLEAAGGLVGTSGDGSPKSVLPAGSKRKFVVPATNVPIGYYESVIIETCVGKNRIKKQLCGWRYVGFAPFNACPDMLYAESTEPPDHGIYGLAFRNGVMMFVRLGQMNTPNHDENIERNEVSTGSYSVGSPSREPSQIPLDASDLEVAAEEVLQDALKNDKKFKKRFPGVKRLNVSVPADGIGTHSVKVLIRGFKDSKQLSVSNREDIKSRFESNSKIKSVIGKRHLIIELQKDNQGTGVAPAPTATEKETGLSLPPALIQQRF